jgi:Immunoglobulin I-set domain
VAIIVCFVNYKPMFFFFVFRFKDARELHKSAKHRIGSDESSTSLTISDVNYNDAGVYRCELSNQHGRVETTGLLIVNGLFTHNSSTHAIEYIL